MKKILSVLLMVLMVSGIFVGCGSNNNSTNKEEKTSKDENKFKIAYTTMDLSNAYFIQMVKGMQEKADEMGVELTVHDGKGDAATQVSAVENFIVQGVDAIVISANDAEALQPMVEKAKEAKIPVLSANVKLEGTAVHFDLIQQDFGFLAGEIAGQWIADKLNGKAEVAVFDYSQVPIVKERVQGIIDGIKSKAPEAEIVSVQDAQTRELGYSVTESVLQAHPNLKVIVGMNDEGPLGAYEAVKAAGKDSEDFAIVGLDAVPEALEKIKEGGIYKGSVDNAPYATGKLVIETAVKVINGEEVEDFMQFPLEKVTSENVDKFLENK